MATAIEKLREEFITEEELASFLGLDPKRLRDLRSTRKSDKTYLSWYKPSAKCTLYALKDVQLYIKNSLVLKSQTKDEND